jgi:hypothetical protein
MFGVLVEWPDVATDDLFRRTVVVVLIAPGDLITDIKAHVLFANAFVLNGFPPAKAT